MRALLIVAVLATPGLSTVVAGQRPGRVPVVAVTGCATPDGTSWLLTAASAPAPIREADRTQRAADSVEWARQERGGTERYRLMGRALLGEFKIDAHRGHRIVVRGLLISDAKEKRINVISLAMVADSCN